MDNRVTDQIPIVDVVAAAHTWAVDEIIKRQPGAYPTELRGDHRVTWHSMHGTTRLPRRVITGPRETRIRQEIRQTRPSGEIKIYTVSVIVEEITEGNGHEPSRADDPGPEIRQLSPADRTDDLDAETESADQAQAPEAGTPGPCDQA